MAKKRTNSAKPGTGAGPEVGQTEGAIAETTEEVGGGIAGISAEQLAALVAQVQAEKPKQQGLLVRYWPMVAAALLIGGWWFFNKTDESKPPPDDGKADTSLVKLANAAFRSPQAAKEFAGSCEVLAEMVMADGESSNAPSLTKRSQVGERLVAELARAAILSGIDVDREALADFVVAAWDDEKEFPQAEGELTKADREMAAKQFKQLAEAAIEVR